MLCGDFLMFPVYGFAFECPSLQCLAPKVGKHEENGEKRRGKKALVLKSPVSHIGQREDDYNLGGDATMITTSLSASL